MQTIQPNGYYKDREDFPDMTRMLVRQCARRVTIADYLCRNAEELLFSMDQPTIDNCRIAGMMLGLAYNLLPLGAEAGFEN